MTKEKYLETKKQARVWFTVNILISLIAITGGSLVIISQSRHIPFLLMSLGAITLMNRVLITPAFNAKKEAEEQHPEWKDLSTKGTKIPVEDFQKGFLISVAALLIVIVGFFMFYRPLPKADPTVSNLTPKDVQILQELEEVLGIASYPMNWPIGMGKAFEGLYDLYNQRLELYKGDERFASLEDGDKLFASNPFYEQVKDDIELLNEAGNEFSEEAILAGELTPVFFGSALTNFGVQTFLETFLKFAPEPHGHKKTDGEIVDPYDKDFSGFVFKIQANMDPRHRDRIAFVRIVSGEFERGMSVNLPRTGKSAKLSNVTQFMAESRENVTNAVAGDIIGVYDTGTYQVGDTLTVGKNKFEFEPLPTFTPEIFMKVSAKNVMKQKSFHKGIEQLVQEGAIQLYTNYQTGEYMLGAVGQLQFEVFKHRMENEYNAEVVMSPMGKKTVRWIKPEDLDERMSSSRNILAKDRFDQPVFLFENDFALRWFADKYPDVELEEKM